MALRRLKDLYEEPLPENPSWITGGVLPKSGITLMGGYAKIGKTFLGINMAYALGCGGRLWGQEDFLVAEPVPTLYLENEVGEYEFQRRLQLRPDGPPDNLYFISKEKGLYLDTGVGRDRLGELIDQTGCRVVIVDPISRVMLGDENSNTDVNKLFQNLDMLIVDFPDLSFVLSHHFGKPPRGRDAEDHDDLSPYNFRGASKWFDAPDCLITMSRIESSRENEWWRIRSRWVMRQAPSPEKDINLVVYDKGVVSVPPATTQLDIIKKRGWGARSKGE